MPAITRLKSRAWPALTSVIKFWALVIVSPLPMRFVELTTSGLPRIMAGLGLKNGSTDSYPDFQSVKLTCPL